MRSKTKNSILLVGFLITLFICYQLAISKTFSLYDSYQRLKKEHVLFDNIPKQQYLLNKQNRQLDSLLGEYQIGGTSLQNNLLKSLNANSDTLGLKLIAFHKAHTFEREKLKVNSHAFIMEGSFEKLLHLLYNLEQRTTFGEVVHVRFEKKRDLRTRRDRLEVELIVQNFK